MRLAKRTSRWCIMVHVTRDVHERRVLGKEIVQWTFARAIEHERNNRAVGREARRCSSGWYITRLRYPLSVRIMPGPGQADECEQLATGRPASMSANGVALIEATLFVRLFALVVWIRLESQVALIQLSAWDTPKIICALSHIEKSTSRSACNPD